MIDTLKYLETPEGVELGLQVAGPVARGLAWALDVLIRLGFYIVLALVLLPMGRFGTGLFLVLLFLGEWFYPVVGEVLFHGATPGKRSLGLRVIADNGTPVTLAASLIRNLLRFVDFLPLFYGVGLVAMMLNRDFRRLGDVAAGTLVVYGRDPRPREGMPRIEGAAPPFELRAEERQAVLDFAERRQLLSDERARELAALTGPLVAGSGDPAESLVRFAAWYAGER
ncbi:MAG: RDD family protein [Gammaproteobacteria bacterium]|nr:RDD family protein [Gammaproteobacteria bacterium]